MNLLHLPIPQLPANRMVPRHGLTPEQTANPMTACSQSSDQSTEVAQEKTVRLSQTPGFLVPLLGLSGAKMLAWVGNARLVQS